MTEQVMQTAREQIERKIQELRAASANFLAHCLESVGPQFGDHSPISDETAQEVRSFDAALLDRAVQGDAKGWFERAAEVNDRYRVCGLAATYTMIHAMGPARGSLLRYDQAINAERTCGVTFASVAYEV